MRIPKPSFTCPMCSGSFQTEYTLRKHLTRYHVSTLEEVVDKALDNMYPGPGRLINRHYSRKAKAVVEVMELERVFALKSGTNPIRKPVGGSVIPTSSTGTITVATGTGTRTTKTKTKTKVRGKN